MKVKLAYNGRSLLPNALPEGEYTIGINPRSGLFGIEGPGFEDHARILAQTTASVETTVRLNVGERSAILVNPTSSHESYLDGVQFRFQTVCHKGRYKLGVSQFECDLILT